MLAPILAFLALILVAAVSFGAVTMLDTSLESAASDASEEPVDETRDATRTLRETDTQNHKEV